MNILSLIAGAPAPHNLWTIIMNWLEGGFGNLGWALLILTLMVKVAVLPLDLMVKYTNKKQMLIQQKCAPQVAKLQKKFGNDRQKIQQQSQALYKHEGLKAGTGCLVMLVNMILTMVIFFSFYGTLRDVSAYNAINQYEQVVEASNDQLYASIIAYSSEDDIETLEDVQNWYTEYASAQEYVNNTENDPESETYKSYQNFIESNADMIKSATTDANKKAVETWEEVKTSWLWVKNIWVADATTSPFPTYDSLVSIADKAGNDYVEYIEKNIAKSDYNKIANLIGAEETKNNGYYILPILAGVITFLSQLLNELQQKLKNKKANIIAKEANAQNNMTMKIMKIIMPIIMIMFVFSSSASFGIYIVASNIASILVGQIVNLIVNRMTRKQQREVEEVLEKEANRLIKKGKLQG